MTRVALVLLLAAGCARERVRDYEGYLPNTDDDTVSVFLVRDRRTGKPIPNATVTQHPEWWIDENGDWAPEWERTKTDRYGLAWFVLDEDPGPCHWAVHADGYSPDEEYGGIGMGIEVDMRRGGEEAGRLLSYDGTPLVGALVEYKTGCAHAPALLKTRTDRTGLFVFRDVTGGDLPFEHPRCKADYWGGYPTRPRALGIPTCVADPGFTIRGRVVTPDGTPPAWCVLTTMDRGARAKTDAEGRFVLRRTYPGAKISLWTKDALFTFESAGYRPGGPLLIVLADSQPPFDESEHVVVKLASAPEESVDVHLDRVSDGRRFSVEVSPGDAAELDVPRGAYLLSAGDPASRYRAPDTRIVVRGPTATTLPVREQPRLRIAGAEVEERFTYEVVLDDRIWEVDPGKPVHLPAAGPAWLRVSVQLDTYTFRIGPARDGVRLTQVNLPGLKRIKVGGTWAGLEFAGFEYADGVLETWAVGRHFLAVMDGENRLARHELDLPFEESELVVDDLVFEKREERTLRVLDERGLPAEVQVEIYGEPSPWWWPDDYDSGTVEDGFFRSTSLRDGASIRISAPNAPFDLVPLWTTLRGDGPYEVRLGSATIVVDARGLEDACLVLDGTMYGSPDNDDRFVLRGVTEGPHDLLVGAKGRIGKAYRLVLKEGETRRLAPELRPR